LIGRFGDRATFDALRRDGRRARRGPMTVTYLAGGDRPRVAFAIGRKVGPAVVRNRLRRRLRAAARDLERGPGGLAPGAYLVSLRPEAAGRSYQDLRRDLGDACTDLTGTVPG
jgi:ribonuclease P protein component